MDETATDEKANESEPHGSTFDYEDLNKAVNEF